MPIPSGLSAQIGVAEESTYGTIVTPSRFYEPRSEGLKMEQERIESDALRSGTRVLRSDRWAVGKKTVEGDIELDLLTKGAGLLFKHMFGGIASSQPDAVGAPTVWKHSFTPGDFPVGLTVQVGRPDNSGTVRPFTYSGCRVSEWELSASVDEIAKLSVSLLGQNEDTATALATASYPSGAALFTFTHATLTVGGTAVDVKDVTLTGSNGLADERYFCGSVLRKTPLEADRRTYEGECTAEFGDLTLYNRFVSGSEAALVLLFEGATISGAFKYQVKITANVRTDGSTPNASGPEVLEQPVSFKCLDTGSGPGTAITLDYQTTDATP